MKRREKKKEGLKESWCEKGGKGIQHLRRERGNIFSFRWKLRKRRWERRKVGNVSSTRTSFLCSRCFPESPEKWQIPLWLQRRLRDGAGSDHEWRGHLDPGRWLRGDRDRERGPGRLPRSLKGWESLAILIYFTKRKTSINGSFTSGFLPPWFCLHMASDQAHDQALRLLWRGGFTFSWFFSQTKCLKNYFRMGRRLRPIQALFVTSVGLIVGKNLTWPRFSFRPSKISTLELNTIGWVPLLNG